MVVIKDEISYIVDLIRERGEITFPNGDLPCQYVVSCYPCTPLSEMESGVYKTHSLKPYFYYGTKREILARLSEKDKQGANGYKYPAIILEFPIEESYPTLNKTEAECTLLFVAERDAAMTFDESYNATIKPVLLPMLENFIIKMTTSESVSGAEVIKKVEAPAYGDDKVVANDYWDVVLLKINFQFLKSCKKQRLCQK